MLKKWTPPDSCSKKLTPQNFFRKKLTPPLLIQAPTRHIDFDHSLIGVPYVCVLDFYFFVRPRKYSGLKMGCLGMVPIKMVA